MGYMKRKPHNKNQRFFSVRRSRSAQVQMTETIAVLFIFFILIMFGLIFYSKYQAVAFKEKQEELLGARAIETTLKTLFLPELICSRGEAEPEDNCFDLLKLNSLNQTTQKYLDDYYFDIFSYARIYVQEVYPGNNTWVVYDKQKPEVTMEEPTYFVITLKDSLASEEEAHNRFGYVAVVIYS